MEIDPKYAVVGDLRLVQNEQRRREGTRRREGAAIEGTQPLSEQYALPVLAFGGFDGRVVSRDRVASPIFFPRMPLMKPRTE